jgi:GT2 family glycosyltransferase/SAM-dependent methyltransferase
VNPADLAVVLPTRGRPHILESTLAGLRAQTVQGYELILVVDGEDQPLPEVAGARVLAQPHRGPGAARNKGVAATQCPLILFLGDDMLPGPDLVATHLDAHRRHPEPEVAFLGGVDWHPDVAGNPLIRWMDREGFQFDAAGLDAEGAEAGWGRFTTANVSVKRSLLEQAGGFDEDFFFLYEDVELGWRLGKSGMRLLSLPGARCAHLHAYDLPGFRGRMSVVGQSERLMTRKHPWFEPWFRPQFVAAMARPRPMAIWPWAVERIPSRLSRLRGTAEAAATTWYLQHAAPAFFENWEGEDDLEELREYLGDRFDSEKLAHHKDHIDREQLDAEDEATFYRTSEAYLYELTMFGRWQIKTPYLIDLMGLVAPPARVLDYGCGIGTDGLRLQRLGYDVSFADFDNPSTRYLRWRLDRRDVLATVHDVDHEVAGGHDLVFCFDVIEHVEDPWGFLDQLEELGEIVLVNLLEPEPEEHHNDLHHPLPIAAMLDHAARRGLLRYRVYHGRSHLIAYRGRAGVRSRGRLASRAERYLGPVLSRLEGLPR